MMPTQHFKPAQPISLATYREIQAHLQQIPDVQVRLNAAQNSVFRYSDSQVDSLEVSCSEPSDDLAVIAQYYGLVAS